jgi:AraC-like DNA-binding protein
VRADLYDPVVCLILQGRKEATFGETTLDIGPGDSLLVSHDMPVRARITSATPAAPYLSIVLRLDLGLIRSLYEEVSEAIVEQSAASAAVVHRADASLIDALGRYIGLSTERVERKVMGPLIFREIHFRLLMAPYGGMLRALLRHDSHASNVSRAITRIRRDFRSSLAVPELAREVGMSTSSFHKHFRDITSSTPLQYQKELRLLEARRLLSVGDHSVTTIAYDVGYGSPNQFSREYARKFGVPPRDHLGQLGV